VSKSYSKSGRNSQFEGKKTAAEGEEGGGRGQTKINILANAYSTELVNSVN